MGKVQDILILPCQNTSQDICEPAKMLRKDDSIKSRINSSFRQESGKTVIPIIDNMCTTEKHESSNSNSKKKKKKDRQSVNRKSSTTGKMLSSLNSSCSSSSDSEYESNPVEDTIDNRTLEKVIDSLKNITVRNILANDNLTFEKECQENDLCLKSDFEDEEEDTDDDEKINNEEDEDDDVNTDDESNTESSDDNNEDVDAADDEDDDDSDYDDNLIARGPMIIKNKLHNGNKPYSYQMMRHLYPSIDGLQQYQQMQQQLQPDYDKTAQVILTDQNYRSKLEFCLDKLSNMNKGIPEKNVKTNQSPIYIPQKLRGQQLLKALSPRLSPPVSELSEDELLEIVARGNLQPAQSLQTTDYINSLTVVGSPAQQCPSDYLPDSPISDNYQQYGTPKSNRPESRASYSALSPQSLHGSNNCYVNNYGSSWDSPQVSPQNLRPNYKPSPPSSTSSSGQSYCQTPSPINYNGKLEDDLETNLSTSTSWQKNFDTTNNLINCTDNTELQLVNEVISKDLNVQVVPNCNNIEANNDKQIITNDSINVGDNCQLELTDDIASALMKIVGNHQEFKSLENIIDNNTNDYNCNSNHFNYLGNDQNQQQNHRVFQQNAEINHITNNLEYSRSNYVQDTIPRQNFPLVSNIQTNNVISTPPTNQFNEFHIPEPVVAYGCQQQKSTPIKCLRRSNSERNIAPWPSLNLPTVKASERLQEAIDSKELSKAMLTLLKPSIEELTKQDQDGDTSLMCLVNNADELKKKLHYLIPLVERLGTVDGALTVLNNRGEDALYLACMNCQQISYAAGYLAAYLLGKGIEIGKRLYKSGGDTLLHVLATRGDSHGEVLAEMLSLRSPTNQLIFDLSQRNYNGRTPLHVAVEAHHSIIKNVKTISLGTSRLLLSNGADPTIRETRCGDTPLHLAISLSSDPSLVKVLIESGRGQEAVNCLNNNHDTPLHMAAMLSEHISLERQEKICQLLIRWGARINMTNRQGKTPLALVSAERKETIRKILHKKTFS